MLLLALLLAQTAESHVSMAMRSGDGVSCRVIQADLKQGDLKLTIALTPQMPGGDSPFEAMLQHRNVVAAINGAYFDKTTKKPIGDIWLDERLMNKGLMGTALCIGSDGSLDIKRVVRSHGVDWSSYAAVLACGPALVLDGKIDCEWAAEGFRDPHVTGSTPRMGVGYNSAGKLLMVYCPKAVTFEKFSAVMKGLGCYEAMNLDGGASLAMWYGGKTLVKPGRRLTNLLVIERA